MKCFGTVWHSKIIKVLQEILGAKKNEKAGVSVPRGEENNVNKRKPVAQNKPVRTEKIESYGYEPTNIGLTFDAEYHVRKKVKSYWKQYYGEEEDLNLSDVLKNL